MKTLVSVLTGRKDYQIFDTDDEDKILEYLKQNDWSSNEVWRDKDIKTDIVVRDEVGLDVFNIININLIKVV